MVPEQRLDHGDGVDDPRQQRVALGGVANRKLEHVAEPPRAVVAEECHPRAERTWHARGHQARAGYVGQAHGSDACDGGRRRRRTLAADHLDLLLRGVPKHDGQIASQAVEVWLDDLEDEARRRRRIEGVASTLKHGKP
jgi:hypothetical protein